MNPIDSLFDRVKIQKLLNITKILPDSNKQNLNYHEANAKATFLILMNSQLADMYYNSHQRASRGLDLRTKSNQLATGWVLFLKVTRDLT